MNECRQSFEAHADFETDLDWMNAHNMAGSDFNSEGGYTDPDTSRAYDNWRRGWNTALKEAAKIVDAETAKKLLALSEVSVYD